MHKCYFVEQNSVSMISKETSTWPNLCTIILRKPPILFIVPTHRNQIQSCYVKTRYNNIKWKNKLIIMFKVLRLLSIKCLNLILSNIIKNQFIIVYQIKLKTLTVKLPRINVSRCWKTREKNEPHLYTIT